MSCLLLLSNRSYLKFPLYTIYRHLSTIERSNADQSTIIPPSCHTYLGCNAIQRNESMFLKYNYQQKRSITLHVPPVDDKSASPKKYDARIPFQFPPGNPNDKPKLEHLRFIEDQLKQILPDFCKRMHPYALYTADIIFENYYDNPPKIMKGAGNYALALFWLRIKLNFKLMNVKVHLLKTTVDEESNCVKIRWRITGLSNQSFVGVLKGWRKPKDVAGNIRNYIEHIDGFSIFYVRGDGRIYKHRVDRVMVDEDKELAATTLTKKKLTEAAAPVSS
ncbi:unnamed protein product [Adineta steineri]|uniref:Uncharacterized protein n=1 Tax=Adineta steineri TaxID=433720 RepID=A0A814T851_9BILA|nr:unnamed protein product [Adineta steineri]CAF1157928.1 unnamed protein product [Adineta steineri]CAF1255843.1 unnamed protein product [Adineta steineri]